MNDSSSDSGHMRYMLKPQKPMQLIGSCTFSQMGTFGDHYVGGVGKQSYNTNNTPTQQHYSEGLNGYYPRTNTGFKSGLSRASLSSS